MGAALPHVGGNVEPLRPIRVLLCSRDRRFVSAATFLLLRSGFFVETAPSGEAAARAADEMRPDVALVDATSSVSAAARIAGAIEGRHPRTRVLLLADDEGLCAPLRAIPKWTSLERLAETVARAYARAEG